MASRNWGSRKQLRAGRRGNRAAGSQLLEFSLALPILLLLVVGAWDFGKAFVLKEKLTNAAREGARITVSTPLMNNDTCTSTTPCSIVAAADAVEQYLANANVNGASCISGGSPTTSSSGLSFTYTCSSGAQLVINRGATITVSGVIYPETQVSLTWPVKWALAALLPKAAFPSTITTTVTMENLS